MLIGCFFGDASGLLTIFVGSAFVIRSTGSRLRGGVFDLDFRERGAAGELLEDDEEDDELDDNDLRFRDFLCVQRNRRIGQCGAITSVLMGSGGL